ncbi:AraC family transcriptional regulator [Bosea caraganae]|uniref:AraC family transcriptional regulator n=1 Tax=Bosea caraganae TaxID=2763117 RepID=A0A370L274_9HYPH|nr:AraC family transcriptional regulator [Bosea caraganae]RDJ22141.1 AraC family transcriptional regulator [Bosea caraganae]RDJ22772.1 AraC family transcriptional regulator [Bosea caraganae]
MTEQNALADLIARYATSDGTHATAIPRLSLIRMSTPTEPIHALHEPALCIVVQGRKQVMLGDRIYRYGPEQYLVVSVDVPIVGQVTEASPGEPYLCFRLDLDPGVLGALIMEAGLDSGASDNPGAGLCLDPVTPELLSAASRLVTLLAAPRDAPILAPLAEREILYRLLTGSQAPRLREIAHAESKLQQVNRAIGWIKRNYDKPFRIDNVAQEARMSASALHQHFKAVTAMSPLQYQKQLRLQEARRLILGQAMDAATAGHNVGYDSPSQFSREYSRLFGAPPIRDIARMRAAPESAALI